MFIDLSLFRKNRNFRYLFAAQLVSSFGSQMTIITVPFQIYHLTRSVFLTGLIGSVELVALALTALYGGVLSDRYNRKKIMILCESVMVLIVSLLAWNASLSEPILPLIFVGAALLSALNGLHRPAVEALLPAVVQEGDLEAVSSLGPMRNILTTVAGPSLAGLILAKYGASWTYIVDALTFVVSILLMKAVHVPTILLEHQPGDKSFWREIRAGIQYLRQRRDILGTYIIDFLAMVLVSPQVLMPHIAELFGAESYVGVLYASPSIGALIALSFSAWTGRVYRHGLAVVCAALTWALCVGSVGLSGNIGAILFFLVLSGFFDMISGIFRMTIWNKTIPSTIRGRMASFEMLSYSSGPLLGQLFIGSMSDRLGYHKALVFGAGLACGLIIVACLKLPELIHYRDRKKV